MRDQIQDQRQKSAIICPAFQRGNFKFSSICLCCLCCVWRPQWQANTELDRIPEFHRDQSFPSPHSFLSVVLPCSCGPFGMVNIEWSSARCADLSHTVHPLTLGSRYSHVLFHKPSLLQTIKKHCCTFDYP